MAEDDLGAALLSAMLISIMLWVVFVCLLECFRICQAFDDEDEPPVGLSPALIASLPTFVHDGGAETPPLDCPICLDKMERNDICRMFSACKHGYHQKCIDRWLLQNGSCPLCRAHIAIDIGVD